MRLLPGKESRLTMGYSKIQDLNLLSATAAEPEERRLTPRFKWNKLAGIYVQDSYMIDCIVKDISETGARLLLADENWLFLEFHVRFRETTSKLKVERVWKNGSTLGVKFVRPKNA